MDIIKQQQKAEREEEERLKKEREDKYRLEQEKLKPTTEEEEEEEEELIVKEYLVYICQCCNKKFNTTNQFKNHIDSKKHRDVARLYEEAGVSSEHIIAVNYLFNARLSSLLIIFAFVLLIGDSYGYCPCR